MSRLSAFIQSWRLKYHHLPWFRRYEFLAPAAAILVLFAAAFLPPLGRPERAGPWLVVAVAYATLFALVITVLSCREKPVLLKRLASLALIAGSLWLFYRYSGAQWERMQEQFFNLEALEGVWPLYWRGIQMTLGISAVSAVLAVSLGLVLGVLRSLRNPVLEVFLAAYIDFFRALPLIVSMVFIFYALPFLGINLSAFWSAVTALVLMNSAYEAEIFRSGIESIPKRQMEAARSLGLRPLQALRLVILPQAVRVILPPMSNNLVSLVKDTAVAYVITVPELLTRARHAVVWKRNPTPVIVSTLIYIATLLPLTRLTRTLENRSKRWVKR